MTYYSTEPFPRPIGPIRATDPRTGRTAEIGDRVHHYYVGDGVVTDVVWDVRTGMGVPVARFDNGDGHARPYGWEALKPLR